MRTVRWTLVLVWIGFLAYLSLGRDCPPPIERALAVAGTCLPHFVGSEPRWPTTPAAEPRARVQWFPWRVGRETG